MGMQKDLWSMKSVFLATCLFIGGCATYLEYISPKKCTTEKETGKCSHANDTLEAVITDIQTIKAIAEKTSEKKIMIFIRNHCI